MLTRTIQGTDVPAIGFGTWELVDDDTFPGVTAALEVGYRHIDTAQAYGNEEAVGDAILASGLDRDEVFLTTKVWNDNLTPERIKESTHESLSKLKTDHVDLLLLHWPLHLDRLEQNVQALVDLASSGAVRHIGVSNFNADQLGRALEVGPIFCDQVEHHAHLAQPDLLAFTAERDVLFTAYSPLARGDLLTEATVVGIAEERDATPAQVLLRWILDEGEQVAAIAKATKRERIEENLGALDVHLTDDDRAAIAALDRQARQVDPPWADW